MVKSESDMSESVSYSFVTCFDFLPAFSIENPISSSLGSKILNMFLLRCRVRILDFFLTHPPILLTLGAAQEYGQNCSAVTFFSKELPTYAIDDVIHPTDCSVRKEGSLNPSHVTDATLKPSSLKAFLENGQMPEFSNTA
jgi:hypothetical protein